MKAVKFAELSNEELLAKLDERKRYESIKQSFRYGRMQERYR